MHRHKVGGLAALLGCMQILVAQAESGSTVLEQKVESLNQRIEQLEKKNAELEQSLQEQSISENEPELTVRLKAIESEANSYHQTARMIESLQGITAGAGLTLLAQGLRDTVPRDDSELNYRADIDVTLPGGALGNAQGVIFGHFRMGQGLGLENPNAAFSSVNATSFQRPGSEASDSTVLLAQAWYQLSVPLPLGGNPDISRKHLEFNFGKMDPFLFFDQNQAADDETRGFVNQAFVHNPLLDAGGDIGVDEFGFTPGLRAAFVSETYSPVTYAISLGVFGAGHGASYASSLSSPLWIAQFETGQRFFDGRAGHYRLYFWRNGRGEDFDGEEGEHSEHAGAGLSIDQQLGSYMTVFMRVGLQSEGRVTFDRAYTVGAEWGGSYWGRGADALGIAIGRLQLADDFSATVTDIVSSAEQPAELYYRYRINENLALSYDLQWIRHPGGLVEADSVKAIGIRAQVGF